MADHSLLSFILATLMLALVPGPDMLYIISCTLSHNKRAGVVAVLGISLGLLVHTLIAACGLAGLIMTSKLLFTVVKWTGAGYLIYIGGCMLLSPKHSAVKINLTSKKEYWVVFKQGLLINLLNPKVIVFFLAFIPQFVDIHSRYNFNHFFFYGCIFNLFGSTVNLSMGLMAGLARQYLLRGSSFQYFQEKITGLILVLLGIRLLFYM